MGKHGFKIVWMDEMKSELECKSHSCGYDVTDRLDRDKQCNITAACIAKDEAMRLRSKMSDFQEVALSGASVTRNVCIFLAGSFRITPKKKIFLAGGSLL